MQSISSRDARVHLSDVINRISYSGEKYTLTRHGHGVAVILSMEEWLLLEKIREDYEDRQDIKDADTSYSNYLKEGGVSLSQVKKDMSI